MRLLFIRSTKSFSGAEKYNVELLRELRKNTSFRIDILTNQRRLAKELGVKPASWLPEEVGTKKQLMKAIFCTPVFIPRYFTITKHADLICLESRTEMVLVTPFMKLFGRKVLWIQHGPFYNSQAAGIIKVLYRWTSRFVTKIIAVSEDTKKDLMNGGVDGKKIVVIYIGVSMTKIKRIIHKQFTVGFLGTLTKEKGTDDFIGVSNLLRSIDTSKQKFLVIGSGPERKIMRRKLRAEYTGFVTDVKRHLARIDVLLFPTHHYEGISMAILEAQAMGIPALAIDIGGNKEIIKHGYNGYLYKLGDVKSMARDIRTLAASPTKLREMGMHARQRIKERFTIEKQSKLFADIFWSI